MVYECCVEQSLSEKCSLASPSGLVPSCRVPQAQAAVKKQPPSATLQSGVMQVWLPGNEKQEPTCLSRVSPVAREVWMMSWVNVETSHKISLVYALAISHLPKAAHGYTFYSWTPGHVLSTAREHIHGFCLKYVATLWDQSCKMDPRSCPLWNEGTTT